ncbi:MAG: hypothetical protein R3B06_00120 [Kofleriaceae bacterium]
MRALRAPTTLLATCLAVAACGGGDDPAGDGDAATAIDAAVDADPTTLPRFSFFVTSLRALQELSGNPMGFGGDLRFGETGPGAGLRGADKLCATIAERSMPGAASKQWRAFLSASDDGAGNVVNAIERIGPGPWYDRNERLLAPDVASLMSIRPQGGDPTIKNDFPNEDGVLNHDPDLTGDVDNHDMLTGTNSQGRLEAANRTCLDWTANAGNKPVEGQPRVGHSWPRGGGGPIDSWMSSLIESGCAPGVSLIEMGPPDPNSNTVGSGGGYGGFYCFALVP